MGTLPGMSLSLSTHPAAFGCHEHFMLFSILLDNSQTPVADSLAILGTHKPDPRLLPPERMGRPTPRLLTIKWYCWNRALLRESDAE